MPRPVVALVLDQARQQRIVGELLGSTGRDSIPAVLSGLEVDERSVEPVDRRDERRAGHREVAEVGAVRALAVVDSFDDLRDHAVDVEIALAVAVRAQVPRHAVHVRREVRAVVQVEAAQEVLVGFAAARVLHRNQSGYRLEQLGNAQHRPHRQIRTAHGALARGVRRAEQLHAAPEDDDLLELIGRRCLLLRLVAAAGVASCSCAPATFAAAIARRQDTKEASGEIRGSVFITYDIFAEAAAPWHPYIPQRHLRNTKRAMLAVIARTVTLITVVLTANLGPRWSAAMLASRL